MKTTKYIVSVTMLSSLCLGISGCSEKAELPVEGDRGIEIAGFNLGIVGRTSQAEATTKVATLQGFSVNTTADPTFAALKDRSDWKMDFTLFLKKGLPLKEETYGEGSFIDAAIKVDPVTGVATVTPTSQCYFPNYLKPQAEAYLYPNGKGKDSDVSADQTSKEDLLNNDVLLREKGLIEVAHNPEITFMHKHAMLDFVIKDVVKADISSVTVEIDGGLSYNPYLIPSKDGSAIGNLEYMLILPEDTKGTSSNPVVVIKTNDGTTSSIAYRQKIEILKTDNATLGSNKCYCFSLQGTDLKISPVTVLNWATGASIPGEYIAVTAYPTFKVDNLNYAEKTFYFYYDNKLVEKDNANVAKPKLQKITFNKNAECTIKPDGRILTHIYKDTEVESIKPGSESMTPKSPNTGKEITITLGTMIVNLTNEMPQ